MTVLLKFDVIHRTLHSAGTLSSGIADNSNMCADLPCFKENYCKFGYHRDMLGCFTCECVADGEEGDNF